MFKILDAESPVEESPRAVSMPRAKGHIKFEGVSMSYDDEVAGVHDITMEALPGQLVAILGDAGSGKSSLVHLIPRFYDVTDGRILINGHDVRDLTLHSLRGNVGIVYYRIPSPSPLPSAITSATGSITRSPTT